MTQCSVAGSPLINADKVSFVTRRVIGAMFGGVLVPASSRASLLTLQLFLFLGTVLIAGITACTVAARRLMCCLLQGVGILLAEIGTVSHIWGVVISGLCAAACTLCILMLARHAHKTADTVIAEEDSHSDPVPVFSWVAFASVTSSPNLHSFLPRVILSGLMFGGVAALYRPGRLSDSHVLASASGTAVLFAFSYFAIAIAQFALIAHDTPEPSVGADTELGVRMARALHVCILCLVAGLLEGEAQYYLLLVLPCLPLAWLMGGLSTPRPLVLWAMEQFNVLFLGGSTVSKDTRLGAKLVFGTASALVVWDQIVRNSSSTTVLTLCAVFGLLNSMDYTTLVLSIRSLKVHLFSTHHINTC